LFGSQSFLAPFPNLMRLSSISKRAERRPQPGTCTGRQDCATVSHFTSPAAASDVIR
jgi:hypothetical protein